MKALSAITLNIIILVHLEAWSVQNVALFLRHHGIDDQALGLLLENNVKGEAIIYGITEKDLVDIGIVNDAAEVVRLFEVLKQKYTTGIYADYYFLNWPRS